MGKYKINIPEDRIKEFCEKYEIDEFSLFGSVLTDEFNSRSDVDILVSFNESARHTLFDLSRMKDELEQLLGYEVDLVSKRGLESSRNLFRKNAILKSAEPIYAAG
ncbi:MAG TPA: nucleotidyltransferase domain-containing protein [Desulfobacteraceae bacterium]|nr:nucleotidyltransferase domain-containing protein [Desulfobacteraceae bacterium]HPJ44317.1 nucleotidyltransferase domain-containing protein [Spirochaetota bacterium]HPQ27037.1 nucleotidyltransferase domain-containing protein [Desulfobacteraceae bacterium]